MKSKTLRSAYFFLLFLGLSPFLQAQNAAGSGDIIFTYINSDGDGFEFMTLTRLDLSSVKFTDCGLCTLDNYRNTETSNITTNASSWTDVPAGTFIRVSMDGSGSGDLNSNDGILASVGSQGNLNARDGESIIGYTGTMNAGQCTGTGYNTLISGIMNNNDWNTGATGSNESRAPGSSTDFTSSNGSNNQFDSWRFNGSIVGDPGTLASGGSNGILNASVWTASTTGSAFMGSDLNLKDIKFHESNYSSGTINVTVLSTTSIKIDASSLSFGGADGDSRYIIVIRAGSLPNGPVDRYTCYLGVSGNFNTAPSVVISATTNSTNACASATAGVGKVVYFNYDLPSALTITNLSSAQTYNIAIYAVNGNGYTANMSTTPATLASVSLPIELLSFTGKKVGKMVKINWSTATERQNDFFEVERAEDGIQFSAIGKIKGAGDSQSTLDYELLDAAPKPGTNYYRLKQTDFDGQYTYSPVVTVQFDGLGSFRLFPVPVKDQLQLQLDEPDAFESQWTVYNALGQLVLSGQIPEDQSTIDLNVSDLTPGMYLLQRTSDRARSSRMFVKE